MINTIPFFKFFWSTRVFSKLTRDVIEQNQFRHASKVQFSLEDFACENLKGTKNLLTSCPSFVAVYLSRCNLKL